MYAGLLTAFVPAKVMVAVGEVDVFFMEDGGPLEGGPCIETALVSSSLDIQRGHVAPETS